MAGAGSLAKLPGKRRTDAPGDRNGSLEIEVAALVAIGALRAVSLPGVGHAAYLEAPDAFNRAIELFLNLQESRQRTA